MRLTENDFTFRYRNIYLKLRREREEGWGCPIHLLDPRDDELLLPRNIVSVHNVSAVAVGMHVPGDPPSGTIDRNPPSSLEDRAGSTA